MPTQAEKADVFRKLHEAPETFVIPNPYDAGTTRILTKMGFKALATTSAGHAFTLGRGDGGVSRDEVLAGAKIIVDATPLPVNADLENGYGATLDEVAETYRLSAEVGLVGSSIEDYTGNSDVQIYDMAEAVDRVAAAVEAVRALPFPYMLTARAENFLRGNPSLDDTIKRLQAYEAAGADVLYAPALPDLETMRTVCQSVSKPVNILIGAAHREAGLTIADVAAAGAGRISVGGLLSRVALGAFIDAARELGGAGTFAWMDGAAPGKDLVDFFSAD